MLKVWVDIGFMASEHLRASPSTTTIIHLLYKLPCREWHYVPNLWKNTMTELVRKCFPLSVSGIEGQLIFSEESKAICISSASWNPGPIILFLCNCSKQAAFMFSRTLFSYCKSGCFIISSWKKIFWGGVRQLEKDQGAAFLQGGTT